MYLKKKRKVLLLTLTFEDTIVQIVLVTANINIIKKSLNIFVVNIWPGSIITIRFSHKLR